MSYHGYLPLIRKSLLSLQHEPRILEIGIDRGVSFVTLAAHLARYRDSFKLFGVDVLLQEQVKLMISNLDLVPGQNVYLIEENSLSVLPKFIENQLKFDVVLLDGDHNYYTVSKELEMLVDLVEQHGIIVVDDYFGRWADRDLFYADREGYKDNPNVTASIETEKHGVKSAVDDFLKDHDDWVSKKLMEGEPIILHRKIYN